MRQTYGNLCSWFYDIDKPIPPKEEHLEITGLKLKSKYINYSKAEYSGQKIEALIYVIVK